MILVYVWLIALTIIWLWTLGNLQRLVKNMDTVLFLLEKLLKDNPPPKENHPDFN